MIHRTSAPSAGWGGRAAQLAFTVVFCIGLSLGSLEQAQARKAGVTGEREVASKRYDEAVRLLEAESLKGADEWYLLGKAYLGLGRKEDAYKAWTEVLLIDKKSSKRKKWTFLFPPNKPLKAKQKKRLKEDFEDEYRDLNGAISRAKELKARELKNQASRTKIEATRKDAQEERLTKIADAKSKTINDKQRMADRRARSGARSRGRSRAVPPRRVKRRSSIWGVIIFGLIIGLIIFFIVSRMRSSRGGGAVIVYHDDDMYDRGPFYYEGEYFRSQDMFYDRYGYYYTNGMYNQYGRHHRGGGHHYDEHMDHEIREDIHEREELYTEAADAGYEADMMRADAAHLEQDAHEVEQELHDGDEALSAFDDGHEFADDDYDDDGGFEDDYGADDGYASADDEFEDDPEA